jgi:hypothetical protein
MARKQIVLFYCIVSLLTFIFAPNKIKAQIPVYKYSFKTDFSIPIVTGSNAYKKSFSGVMAINSAFTFHTPKGIFARVGLHYLQNKTGNSRNFNLGVLEVKHHVVSPNIGLGYEFFNGDRFVLGIEANYFRSFGEFTRSLVPDSISFKPVLTQNFNEYALNGYVSFYTDENLSFGINLGYHYQNYTFDPFPFYFDVINNTTNKEDISNNNGYITFGLGFIYHFSPFKKQPIRENK